MKLRILLALGTASLIWAAGQAQVLDTPVDPTLEWAVWGRDTRRSHFQPDVGGLTNPQIRWLALGGALDEPTFYFGLLLVPQMPSTGAPRHVRYGVYDAIAGLLTDTLGPYWGQASTPHIFSAAVYVLGNDNSIIEYVPNWPVLAFAGGQYDSLIIAPNPGPVIDLRDNRAEFQAGSSSAVIRGRPAYHTNFGAYTDGAVGYTIFADNFGNITALGLMWLVTVDAAALQQDRWVVLSSQLVFMDDTTEFARRPGAVYGMSASPPDRLSNRVLISDHSGRIAAYDPTLPPPPNPQGGRPFFRPVWSRTVQALSADDRVDPDDPNSDLDPIPSDTFDRPVALSPDSSVAIVCASNYGRVYAVNTLNGAKLWGRKLDNQRRIGIMGGPAIGPDTDGDLTVYVVGRTSPSRSSLYALDLATGAIKWVFDLQGISRCTPTIDANGLLYIGNDRGFLFCIRPRQDDTGADVVWTLYLGAPIRTSPVLVPVDLDGDPVPDPLLIVAASNRLLYAIQNAPTLRQDVLPADDLSAGIGNGINR